MRQDDRAHSGRAPIFRLAMTGGTALLFVFVTLPILSLFMSTSPAEFLAGIRHPIVLQALCLSLFTTLTTLTFTLLLGTPAAWLLVHAKPTWARLFETCLQVPLVIPPSVAGFALLLAFGRKSSVGHLLEPLFGPLSFTTTAVILAQLFVSMPLYLLSAMSTFRQLNANWPIVARSLGASPARVFLSIALPLSYPGLVLGAASSWARALGEFGATLMFAGNSVGRTQTLPLAIYTALETDLRAAQALSVILVAFAFAFLLLVRRYTSAMVEDGRKEAKVPV